MPEASEDFYGRITDADVARARAQVGIPVPLRHPEWNDVADRTAIAHFAFGYGDDNPLWHDDDYARGTRWRGRIAPPMFPISAGVNETPPVPDDQRGLFRGLYRGVGRYFAGCRWEWYRPLRAGERLYQGGRVVTHVEEKRSTLGADRSVLDRFRIVYATSPGDVVAVRTETYVNVERAGSKRTEDERRRDRARYDEAAIAAIDAAYDAEERRGSEPRWFEDVHVADALGTVVKGPLTVLDVIAMHMGIGFGVYGFGPLRYASRLRRRAPALFETDEHGVPDAVQRIHWDERLARATGQPAPFDYGQMRTCWVTHLLTSWAGDDAWLLDLELDLRGFNYVGDTHWCAGEIIETGTGDHGPQARVALRATNQEGTDTATGTATVLLPSRDRGLPVLPVPSDELRATATAIVAQGSATRVTVPRS